MPAFMEPNPGCLMTSRFAFNYFVARGRLAVYHRDIWFDKGEREGGPLAVDSG
jgi:hypothetical protein